MSQVYATLVFISTLKYIVLVTQMIQCKKYINFIFHKDVTKIKIGIKIYKTLNKYVDISFPLTSKFDKKLLMSMYDIKII